VAASSYDDPVEDKDDESLSGYYHRVKYASSSTSTDMIIGLYLPSKHEKDAPILFWLVVGSHL
jgi:hypothetical protein